MQTARTLLSWIGAADLRASVGDAQASLGPIGQAVAEHQFNRVMLLSNYPADQAERYLQWLRVRAECPLELRKFQLSAPTNFREIFEAVSAVLEGLQKSTESREALTFHLSPGTPAMAAVWILVAKSLYPAQLIESSREQGVRVVDIPFDIAAEFLPAVLEKRDRSLERLSTGLLDEGARFDDIIFRSPQMYRAVARAKRAALGSVPVLIEGESGTGKELLARAIHKASPRSSGPFIAVNCGAIPTDLTESELFGHKKGAFTGALQDRKGHFEAASAGTLFLDEIGELPLAVQVKLLRVLQERQVVPVGATHPVEVDARIVAATNRSLSREAVVGRFRRDLFYRLAVAVIKLPALRDREGDLSLLIESLMEKINSDDVTLLAGVQKKLSVNAKNILLKHNWPGNVRELQNTLTRAAIWSEGPTITDTDIDDALLDLPEEAPTDSGILDRQFGQDFDINHMIAVVARHYLSRAMRESDQNMSEAAKLLGLGSYKTVGNWIKKYGLDE